MKQNSLNKLKKQQPLVSIIMGVYNEETTIATCIESILNQTYQNWEFIICNDCSRDNTLKILTDYTKLDRRIIILSNEKNMRLAASLNKCLKFAKGKYIARMDADDESLPERLSNQVKYLEEHPDIDCVGCSMIVFDGISDKGIRILKEIPTKEDLLRSAPFAHPTIMMRKKVYDELNGYTISKATMRAEDLDLWIRFYSRGYMGYNIQEALYRYHESYDDFNKRTLKAAIGIARVFLSGYKRLHFPKYKYFFALKPIISALLPNSLMHKYHKLCLKEVPS